MHCSNESSASLKNQYVAAFQQYIGITRIKFGVTYIRFMMSNGAKANVNLH